MKRVGAPELGGDVAQRAIPRAEKARLRRAEHVARHFIVRRQALLPIVELRPARIAIERVGRLEQRVRVHQRAAADARAGKHEHVLQQRDALDAVKAQRGEPQKFVQKPIRFRKFAGLPAPTRLEHEDAIALFGEPERAHRAPEATADDQKIRVEIAV